MFTDEDVDAEVDGQMDSLIDRARAKRLSGEVAPAQSAAPAQDNEAEDHAALSAMLEEKGEKKPDDEKSEMATKVVGKLFGG